MFNTPQSLPVSRSGGQVSAVLVRVRDDAVLEVIDHGDGV